MSEGRHVAEAGSAMRVGVLCDGVGAEVGKDLRAMGFKTIHTGLEGRNVGFECANPLVEL